MKGLFTGVRCSCQDQMYCVSYGRSSSPKSVYDRPPYWGRPDVLHVFLTEGLPSPSLFDLAEYSVPVCGAEAEGELRLLQSVT